MRHVVVIHGGDSFLSYQEYLRYLNSYRVTRNSFLPRHGWKDDLPRALGRTYQVFLPQMPNKYNARYREWKLWFQKMLPYVHHGVILVGHSQGGIFLLKYLSENKFPKKIRALLLVAPPHSRTTGIGDFHLTQSLSHVAAKVPDIRFYYSPDDPVVPFNEMKRYQADLPTAKYLVYKHRGHFLQSRFPELVRQIKAL